MLRWRRALPPAAVLQPKKTPGTFLGNGYERWVVYFPGRSPISEREMKRVVDGPGTARPLLRHGHRH